MENEVKTLLQAFSEKPVAYMRIYAKITGSVTAGVLLSQIVYWHYAMKEQEFWKTDEDFCSELSMGLYEFKAAKKKIENLCLIKTVRKGIPAKTYYTVNTETLLTLITSCGKNPQL